MRSCPDPWKDQDRGKGSGADGERFVPFTACHMLRDALKQAIAHLRFTDYKKPPAEQKWEKRRDPLWKIRGFMERVRKNCQRGWTCYQMLTVDESMVRLKSKRCCFVQYMPVWFFCHVNRRRYISRL